MEVTTIMLLDRAIGMFALMICPLLVAPFFPKLIGSQRGLRGLLWATAAIATTMLIGILISFSTKVRKGRLVSWAFQKLPLGSYAERVFATVHAYRHNLITLLSAVGISLLAHTMIIGVILLVAEINQKGLAGRWELDLLAPFVPRKGSRRFSR